MQISKHALTGLAALTLLDIAATTASAQTVTPNWTGGYIGIHGGVRLGTATVSNGTYLLNNPFDLDPVVPAGSNTFHMNGAIVGGHAGYNLMLGPAFLIGLETDFSLGAGSDDRTRNITIDGFAYTLDSHLELTWQASLRGRAGVVVGPVLFYTTAGVAFAEYDWRQSFSRVGGFSITSTQSEILTGYVVGAGTEWAITSNVTVRTEYLFEDFGSFKVPLAAAIPTGTTGNADLEVHKIRMGVSFKF